MRRNRDPAKCGRKAPIEAGIFRVLRCFFLVCSIGRCADINQLRFLNFHDVVVADCVQCLLTIEHKIFFLMVFILPFCFVGNESLHLFRFLKGILKKFRKKNHFEQKNMEIRGVCYQNVTEISYNTCKLVDDHPRRSCRLTYHDF